MSRVFGHGDLRLFLLKLLSEGPKHGYELIRALEDRFLGMYSPSPGTVYPRLAALEEDALVVSEEQDGRKVYRLTDKGREELSARSKEVEEVGERVAHSARDLAKQIRDEVRSSVRDLRRDMRDSTRQEREESPTGDRDVRAGARDDLRRTAAGFGQDLAKEIRSAVRDVRREERRVAREVHRGTREVHREVRGSMRSLQSDLEAFVTDVISAARRHNLDQSLRRAVQDALIDAREAIIDALGNRPRPRRDD